MISVQKLIEELNLYPLTSMVYAHEGISKNGIVIVNIDENGNREQIGFICADEWHEDD